MHLMICEERWDIVVTNDELKGGVSALAVQNDMTIYISSRARPARRLNLLEHEATHPYVWATAMPRTEEEVANMAQTVARTVREQVNRQGGVKALISLRPKEEDVEDLVYADDDAAPEEPPFEATPAPVRKTVQPWASSSGTRPTAVHEIPAATMVAMRYCPQCQRPVHPSTIVDEQLEDPTYGPVLYRTIHCDCIKGLWSWFEPAGPGWKPAPGTGSLEREPRVETDPEKVREWLERNPNQRPME